jgi:hypothetical protein
MSRAKMEKMNIYIYTFLLYKMWLKKIMWKTYTADTTKVPLPFWQWTAEYLFKFEIWILALGFFSIMKFRQINDYKK